MVLVALATGGQPFPGTLVPSGKQMEDRLWDNDVVLCIYIYVYIYIFIPKLGFTIAKLDY